MNQLFSILLIIHIAGGTISLMLGLYLLLSKKGSRVHRKVGNIYLYAMLSASAVALPMSYIHPNYFLFIVGVFTTYMLLTGKRYLKIRSTADVKLVDWLLSGAMMVFGLAFIVYGLKLLLGHSKFGIVLLVFGFISLAFVRKDWRNYRGKSGIANIYLTTHLQRMIGSYIASVTAFLVVNNSLLPEVLAWLLPTVVLTPLIISWTKKYARPITTTTLQKGAGVITSNK